MVHYDVNLKNGSGLKKIGRQVAEASATMESILMDTIHRLYARAVTLATAAVNEGENQERKGFLTDLIDSIHEKTTRFLLMRERMRKKIKKQTKYRTLYKICCNRVFTKRNYSPI